VPQNLGRGNQLEVIGDCQSLGQVNPDILPAPGPEFFHRRN